MAMPRKLRCRVERIVDHGGRVYTLELRPEHPAPRFAPGQFLHLAIDDYQPGDFWPESRVFSIASAPEQRELLCIAYSVVGRFTTRMERELHEGDWVWVKLPYGEFTVRGERNVALFAGGTGITAFTAFIAGLSADFPHRVNLFYGARRPELLLFTDIIEACAERVAHFAAHYYVEDLPCSLMDSGLELTTGRLDIVKAWPLLRDPLATDYYLSGPPAMLAALSANLRAHSVPVEAIKMDAWE